MCTFDEKQSKESPREFAERLKGEGEEYNGFNLIVGDIGSKSMYYISNRPNEEEEGIIDGGTMIKEVTPGLHVLSNAILDSPWHKAQRLRLRFTQEIAAYGHDSEIPLKHIVDQVMKDTLKADPSLLPHICSLDWEFNLSSIFVHVHTPLVRILKFLSFFHLLTNVYIIRSFVHCLGCVWHSEYYCFGCNIWWGSKLL